MCENVTSLNKLKEVKISGFRAKITERVAVTKGKGQNSFTKRKTGECFQWKANGSCSKGDSCSFLHSHAFGKRETSAEWAKNTGVSSLKPAVDNERRRKGKGQVSSSVPTGKGRTDDKRSKIPEARPAMREKKILVYREQDVENRRVIVGILPCVVITSLETGASMGNSCLYRHADGEETPSKRSKSESTHWAVAIRKKKKKVQGCVSLNSEPKKSILR